MPDPGEPVDGEGAVPALAPFAAEAFAAVLRLCVEKELQPLRRRLAGAEQRIIELSRQIDELRGDVSGA